MLLINELESYFLTISGGTKDSWLHVAVPWMP